ncbi:helix-turn-helix domain-containing protein [Patescibacteria group bacterium]|nr:helix-turn-helix domain-containing protein [Patescibacteria group bacterium]
MRTIGEVIKQARIEKNFSLAQLEKETKIKKSFIEALEKGNWKDLPELPVITGFVKNIASALKISKKQALALLRRDYPPKKLSINPKPDVSDKFTWSPKLTFLIGSLAVFFTISTYLGFQYKSFMALPNLEIETPQENQVVTKNVLTVSGLTETEATIKVNNQPVLVDENGKFSAEIEVFEGTKEIVIQALSRSGKETVIRRTIVPKLESTN